MTDQSATVVNRNSISAIWLVPFIAFIFVGWLLVKSAANQGVFITIEFESANGIEVGRTEVRYRGLTAGKVTNITVSDSLKSVIVEVEMIGSTAEALTENTQFWFVTADVSLQGIKGLDTLISGSYINMKPDLTGEGKAKRKFIGLTEQPPLDTSTPGLHIKLAADTLGSVEKNSPVTFKQLTVGYVSGYRYVQQTNQVEIDVFIEHEFMHLVNASSRFWNASGVDVSGSISDGIKVRTESLASIISGGIAFDHDSQSKNISPVESGHNFVLHRDFDTAKLGYEIELNFAWDSGIEKGAPIVYHGMSIGRVDEITAIDATNHMLTAKAKMNPRIAPFLTDESQFYVVTPNIDLGGETNVSSLIKGAHLSVVLSEDGELANAYNVLSKKPPLSYKEPGVHLVLKAKELKSVNVGSGVFYKDQKVGNVQSIAPNGHDSFELGIFIEPDYAQYVTEDSRFWHASGLKVSAGLQGLSIETPAIQALLKGGIAFDHGKLEGEQTPENGSEFMLFDNRNIAKQRLGLTLAFAPQMKDVKPAMRVIYQDVEIGSVHHTSTDGKVSYAQVGLLPEYEFLLTENSQFFVIEPEISLSGITDTTALFGGAYISLYAGDGQAKNQFVLSQQPPKKPLHAEGLQLVLKAEHGGGINRNSKISYRGIQVGQIDHVALSEDPSLVDLHITIDEEYQGLVSPFTRFYNASGVNVSGNLSQFKVQTETLDTVLKGGISFYNPEVTLTEPLPVEEGSSFELFADQQLAQSAGKAISIYFKDFADLKPSMDITYRGQQVGQITKLVFDKEGVGATAVGFLNELGKGLALEGSQFWFARPRVGLVGNKNFEAIISGGAIAMMPGSGEPKQNFVAKSYEPALKSKPYGLNITLATKYLASVRVGNPVLYRQVKVGEVIGVELADTADSVLIYVNIAERYAPLVTANSQFWNASGIEFDGGLFSGVSVKASSIETLMAGGISFATPSDESLDSDVTTTVFTLHEGPQEKWLNWQPQISLAKED
ncbi:MCE family protein [Thalassotalea sp. LPB0316]|uniref:PqiB family protein n=1 Tax=Thalassotalea sp. LPB0316 TaxID=2769490 RepID=UPI0018667448|nr:MlaD family protein [Thalassotalea sp. LPB0316]QOL26449.1 MCE family protein [Thalassotalea sp. LPB0316]